jgi:hypothetical protein
MTSLGTAVSGIVDGFGKESLNVEKLVPEAADAFYAALEDEGEGDAA